MEVCCLSKGYENWIVSNGPLLQHGLSESEKSKVLVVGATIHDSVRVIRSLGTCLDSLSVELFFPLGDSQELYKFWRSPEGMFNVRDAFNVELLKNNVSGGRIASIRQEKSLHDLPDDVFDIVVFAPLAFGAVENGAAAFDAIARAHLIQSVLGKTKAQGGKVLFSCRDQAGWQELVYKGNSFEALGEGFAGHLKGTVNHFRHYPILSDLEIPAFSTASEAIKHLLFINSYHKHQIGDSQVEQVMKTIAQESRRKAVLGDTTQHSSYFLVEERATLYVASRSEILTQTSNAEGLEGQEMLEAAHVMSTADGTSPWWPNGREGEFFNCGLDFWARQRAEWRKQRGPVESTPPAPVPYEQVIAGLASLRRTYELPNPMRLSELIEIYLDIWESQDGY